MSFSLSNEFPWSRYTELPSHVHRISLLYLSVFPHNKHTFSCPNLGQAEAEALRLVTFDGKAVYDLVNATNFEFIYGFKLMGQITNA